MANFSKEYCDNNIELGFRPSFSYWDLADNMKEGEDIPEICEGLGSLGLYKMDGIVYLVFDTKVKGSFLNKKPYCYLKRLV